MEQLPLGNQPVGVRPAARPPQPYPGPPLRPLSPVRVLAYLLGDRTEVERVLAEAREMPAVKDGTLNANAIWRLLSTWRRGLPYEALPARLAMALEMVGRFSLIQPSEPPKAGDVAVYGEGDTPQRLELVVKEPAEAGGRFRLVDENGYRMDEGAGVLYWLRPGGT